MLSYASPDGAKIETVRVAYSGLALRATGYIVSTREPMYGASYSVAVDAMGRTKRITLRTDDVAGERSLTLTRPEGGPWIAETATGSVPQPLLAAAQDVYVADSAFFVSLPVRRLGLHTTVGAEAEVTVASISLPDLTVTPHVHHGLTDAIGEDGVHLTYTGSYREGHVTVDSEGLFVSIAGRTARVA